MAGRTENVDEILAACLDIFDPAERAVYLQQACGGNQPLRREVESLLAAYQEAGDFLEEPPSRAKLPAGVSRETAAGSSNTPRADLELGSLAAGVMEGRGERQGDCIGRFRLLERIGEGGFGDVWMAEQQEPVRRRVALKIIKLGMDTRQVVARFEAERQALALMDHPNIAKVFDGGVTATGRPYFVMELVRGIKITDYCDQNSLPLLQRLELFVRVCHAVQHAHQKGIIHRDLKPSNILVTLHDGVPFPKVIDFGIAKATEGRLTDKTLLTRFEQFIGTPCYMSPEQADLGEPDIDTRSDIYSLGVLLYELLTGKTPFDANTLRQASLDEVRRAIREQEPVRPSTRLTELLATEVRRLRSSENSEEAIRASSRWLLQTKERIHTLRGDLDWIVMKCLEKDRARRYETANGLARDIQRHLQHEPVMARPPSSFYHFQKFARRNRILFAAAALVILSVILGLSASTWLFFRERKAHRAVQAAEVKATENLWQAYLAQARATRVSGQPGRRFDSLDALVKAAAIRRAPELRNEAIAALALSDVRIAKRLSLAPNFRQNLGIDSEFTRYALVDNAGNVSIRRFEDEQELAFLPGFGFHGVLLRFSPDGRFLAVKYDEPDKPTSRVLRVWELALARVVLSLTNYPIGEAVDFHPRDPVVAVGLDFVGLYHLQSGALLKKVSPSIQPWRLRFSPDGENLAVSSLLQNSVVILDLCDEGRATVLSHDDAVLGIQWHPNGRVLAAACCDQQVHLWDVARPTRIGTLRGHRSQVSKVAFSADGALLASAGWDSTICIWDFARQERLIGFPGKAPIVQFDPTARWLAAASTSGDLTIFEVATGSESRTFQCTHQSSGFGAVSHPAGRLLALCTKNGISLWDSIHVMEIAFLPFNSPRSVEFTTDGQRLVISGRAGVEYWPIRSDDSGEARLRLGPPRRLDGIRETERICAVAGTHKIAIAHGSSSQIVDLHDPSIRLPLSAPPAATFVSVSPNGQWVAIGTWNGTGVTIYDAVSGASLKSLDVEGSADVLFSPDGKYLAIASRGEYSLWSVEDWKLHLTLDVEDDADLSGMAFSPDGQMLAIRQSSTTMRLIRSEDARELASFPGDHPMPFCFSPDATLLVAYENKGAVRIWDLRLVRQRLAKLNLDWDLPPYPPAPNTPPPKPLRIEVVTD